MSDDLAAAKAEAEADFRAMKAKTARLSDDGLDLLFRDARTCYGWQDKPVAKETLKRLVAMSLLPPTSANMSPARFVFVTSAEAKEKLKPCLASGNVEKSMAAPVTAIIGYDPEFWRHMDRLFPWGDMKTMFEKSAEAAEEAAFRNGTLMGAYAIMAARALGLDCGPMSGFNPAAVDEAFFAGTSYKANFLCNLGYGDPTTVKPRGDKFAFDEIATIA
jgi:3-hydroxypropanoate dehydrogenase